MLLAKVMEDLRLKWLMNNDMALRYKVSRDAIFLTFCKFGMRIPKYIDKK